MGRREKLICFLFLMMVLVFPSVVVTAGPSAWAVESVSRAVEVSITLTQIIFSPNFHHSAEIGVLLHILLHIPHEVVVNYNLSRVNATC